MPFSCVPLFLALESIRHSSNQVRIRGRLSAQTPLRRFLWAAALAWVFGAVTVTIAFFWTTQPAILFGGINKEIAYPAFLGYAILSGTFFIVVLFPFILGATRAEKRSNEPLSLIAMSAAATGLEIWTPRFFHWSLGSLMHNSLALSQLASVLGFSGLTLVILLSNSTLARAISDLSSKPSMSLTRIVSVMGIWLILWSWGNWRLETLGEEFSNGPQSHVGLIQPNFTFDELSSNPTRSAYAQDQSLETLLRMSETLVESEGGPLDLLVWPESVAPARFAHSQELQEQTKDLAQKLSTPILVQATEFDMDEIRTRGFRHATVYSSSFLIRPDRSRSPSYQKWVPIPFGESVPFEELFPQWGEFIREHVGNTSKVGRGTSFEAIPYTPSEYVAPLICFDAINPMLPRLQTRHGQATLLVNQSNFVWMGESSAGYQFRELVRFRAIETGRSAILAANTGPSVIFDPTGRPLTDTTALMRPAHLSAHVPIWRGTTLFSFWGRFPLGFAASIGIVVLFLQMSNLHHKKSSVASRRRHPL